VRARRRVSSLFGSPSRLPRRLSSLESRSIDMPMVGDKKFGYGAKGMAAAKKAAVKTGKPMKMVKPKAKKSGK
jgi:hypothetical protein